MRLKIVIAYEKYIFMSCFSHAIRFWVSYILIFLVFFPISMYSNGKFFIKYFYGLLIGIELRYSMTPLLWKGSCYDLLAQLVWDNKIIIFENMAIRDATNPRNFHFLPSDFWNSGLFFLVISFYTVHLESSRLVFWLCTTPNLFREMSFS